MRKIGLIIMVLIFCGAVINAQTTANISANTSGWKRIAELSSSAGRGKFEVTVITGGGNYAPHMVNVKWFKGWSDYGGLQISNQSTGSYMSSARITSESEKAYLELYFNTAVTNNLKSIKHDPSWGAIALYEGELPDGSGTVVCSAKVGKFNVDDKFFVNYNGKVGIGTTSPGDKLSINSGNIDLNKGDGNPYPKIALRNSSLTTTIFEIKRDASSLLFNTNSASRNFMFTYNDSKIMCVGANGKVDIGDSPTDTDPYKLAVDGIIRCGELKVEDVSGWSDFVFAPNYKLLTLAEVENHIKNNGHLPDVPSAAQVEKEGYSMAEMDATLLQKIEELTLYTIEQEKVIETQEVRLKIQEESIKTQDTRLQELEKQNNEFKSELQELKEIINALNK